jgi:hypothetical protein
LVKLQKALDPASDLHKNHNTIELRCVVKEAHELLVDPLCALSQDTHLHLHLVVKGIITEPKPKKKKSKPELVLDEEDLI